MLPVENGLTDIKMSISPSWIVDSAYLNLRDTAESSHPGKYSWQQPRKPSLPQTKLQGRRLGWKRDDSFQTAALLSYTYSLDCCCPRHELFRLIRSTEIVAFHTLIESLIVKGAADSSTATNGSCSMEGALSVILLPPLYRLHQGSVPQSTTLVVFLWASWTDYKANHLFISDGKTDESKVALNSWLHFVPCLLSPHAAWCGGKHTPTALKCVSAKVSPGAAAFFFLFL